MSLPSAQRVCLDCGLCCAGGLFAHAQLDDRDDEAQLVQLGFRVGDGPEGRAFELRCAHLDDTRCNRYQELRPYTCGAFRCGVLRRLDAGELDEGRALALVAEARAAAAELSRALEQRDPALAAVGGVRRKLEHFLTGQAGVPAETFTRESAEVLRCFAVMDALVRRWFVEREG